MVRSNFLLQHLTAIPYLNASDLTEITLIPVEKLIRFWMCLMTGLHKRYIMHYSIFQMDFFRPDTFI